MPPVVSTTGLFLLNDDYWGSHPGFFSKDPVKTYPHSKINIRGIAFDNRRLLILAMIPIAIGKILPPPGYIWPYRKHYMT